MKTMQEVSPFPLTPELFDAIFESEAFRARLKAHWEEVAAEKQADEEKSRLASVRLHGTECILREEFSKRPNATEEEKETRRQELYAEFDRQFI